jgi:intracellular multiplication protein IcmK
MDKGKFKQITMLAALMLLSSGENSWAADAPELASNYPSQADIVQFQEWLKTNGQGGLQPTSPPFLQNKTASSVPVRKAAPSAIVVANNSNSPVISKPMTYRQSQDAMLKAAPPSSPPSPEAAAAFNLMMQQNMPLTPQQVVKLRQLIDTSQRAASIPATVPPKPVSTTLIMNLAPGATPPAIRLAQGYVTSLVFVDSSGSPWPVASYDLGDAKATNIQWDGKSNILLVQAATPYGDSNLVVRLSGMPTPITLQLVSGQRVVDYRTDIHVPGIGPNTKDLPTGVNLPDSANQLLLSVLDGVAPSGSKLLTVKGGDCQAWLLGDKMYLRTRLTVLSPGWVGRMTSPDGMYAYEIQKSSSVLVSQYGDPIELKIEGF